jgi:putative molybdopterin biosynthesis protein
MSATAGFLQRRPLPEARALLLAGVGAVDDEEIAVEDASGRIAAEDVVAQHRAPHYRASAMDGIAVRSADTWDAAEAPVVLEILAAAAPAPTAGSKSCVVVDTGSLLPEWADAVVRIEDTTPVDGGYRIKAAVPPGRDIRRAGEDIDEQTAILAAGSRIRAWDIGAMLATGATRVRVRRRPRVGILATGSEVVEPSGGAGPGQVLESNSRVIAALVEEWGGSAHRLGIVADDEAALARAIAEAAHRFDAVCVIAGSSAGRKDFTIGVLGSLGDVFVHGVDISPGRPVALARISGGEASRAATPVVAVPGYPVSAIVVCEQLLRPLVAALLGTEETLRARLAARVVRKIPSRMGMEEFRRVCLTRQPDGRFVVAPLPSGAGSISTVSGAHAWLRIDATAEGVDAGTDVDVELLVAREDVEAAFVLAGEPSVVSATLQARLRGADPRARVVHLRRGAGEALASVGRGEAHGAIVTAEEAATAGAGFDVGGLPGTDLVLAVAAGRLPHVAKAVRGAAAPGKGQPQGAGDDTSVGDAAS